MPIEKMRSLSLLIMGAVTGSWISGDFLLHQWMIYMACLLPLWTHLDLERIRRWWLWSLLVYSTIIGFGVSQYLKLDLRESLFFLILACVIYEAYGETRKYAPARLLGLLSFLFLVAQIRSEFGLDKFFCIFIYNLGLVAALVTFQRGGIHLELSGRRTAGFVGSVVLHVVLISCIGLGVFWFLPRISDDSNAVMANFYEQQLAGFGDSVNLNDISSLKSKAEHVMNITPLQDEAPHSRYVKGRVLDLYHGGVWTSMSVATTYSGNPETRAIRRSPASQEDPLFRYRIDLNATREQVLFFFDNFVALEGPIFPAIIHGGGGDIRKIVVDRGYGTSLTYQVTASQTSVATNADHLRSLTHVPPTMPYLRAYADRILGSTDSSPLEEARRLERYFQTQYEYTLEVHNSGQADPIRHFIEVRRGHCELFASTMALMLRSRGVPARLAVGFLMPNKNYFSNFYYVTTAEAHAWVEVYDGQRWHAFDPTAPSATAQASPWWRDRVEYMKWIFRRSVVSYDQEKQLALLQQVPIWLRNNRGWIGGALLLVFFTILATVVYRKVLWSYSSGKLPLRVAALLHQVEQRYGSRRAGERVDTFLERVLPDGPLRQQVLALTTHYQEWRFAKGARYPTQDLLADVTAVERQLKADH